MNKGEHWYDYDGALSAYGEIFYEWAEQLKLQMIFSFNGVTSRLESVSACNLETRINIM